MGRYCTHLPLLSLYEISANDKPILSQDGWGYDVAVDADLSLETRISLGNQFPVTVTPILHHHHSNRMMSSNNE